MVRKQFQIHTFIAVLLAAAPVGMAATILGGLEDGQGSSGLERNGDFNDVIFEIAGNVSIDAPGGMFSNLSPAVVNQTGTVFWDNPSGDGPDMNIGYCLLGEAKCTPAGAITGNFEYLSTPSGGSVNDVTFDATGTVTLTVLGGITANLGNTLGWYDLADPGVKHQLAAVAPDSSGETASFTPDGAFALYSTDGWGQVYSSVSASNVDESSNQQHFAFFEPQSISSVPEPSTAALAGIGAVLLGLGSLRRTKR
jgi:hypothetical protein